VHPWFRRFSRVSLEERLELESLKGMTKAKELGARCLELLSLRPPLKLFSSRRFSRKTSEKRLLEIPYKFINSYGGTRNRRPRRMHLEMHPPPWLHGPVLPTGIREPGNRKFSSAGTCKKYRRTIDSGTASRRKIMKNITYRVLVLEYSIRVSPCIHEMQRGTRLACMLV
jgi:hypothetical protein